jgi:hypothetical protein
MIFKAPGQPTKTKKTIYLIASTILGLLLSFIAHILIEINYLKWISNHKLVVSFYNGCALLPAFQIGLFLLGAIGGFFLGRFWWRKIYIERVWEKKKI